MSHPKNEFFKQGRRNGSCGKKGFYIYGDSFGRRRGYRLKGGLKVCVFGKHAFQKLECLKAVKAGLENNIRDNI